jgi:hypothetical protein
MKKSFVIQIPDEPFKNSFVQGKTVNAEYYGPRYLLLAVDKSTKTVEYVAQASDESADVFNLEEYKDVPDVDHVSIDASENLLEAAYITNQYTNEKVEDYTETLPNGDVWTYDYPDGNGILSDFWHVNDIKYDITTRLFTHPSFHYHALTRSRFFDSVNWHITTIGAALEDRKNTYSVEERDKLESFKTRLTNLETTMKNVDHWKIVWPTDLPRY